MTLSAIQPASGRLTDPTDLRGVYRLMVLIRRFEESLYRKYREGKIGGYLHRYDGQEALVAGVVPHLRSDDVILCTYRDHAQAVACGTELRAVMSELLGKATGCAGGKGGSMHLIDPANGFFGGDGIVGGPVPVSAGVGFAIKYRGGDQVCACYFGDGAMNQGGVHEAFNMAGLWNLPVLYLLENNGYAMGTSVGRSTGQPDMVAKARAHGIEGETVDGMDVQTVLDVAGRAIHRIRTEGRPYFLEMRCYRFMGHGVADNAQQQAFYRSPEELEAWKRRDPLPSLRTVLLDRGLMTDGDEVRMFEEIDAEIEDAIAFAEASPEPAIDTLYENVFPESDRR